MHIIVIIVIAAASFLLNIPLGRWKTRYRKFSFMWFLLIHASVPVIIAFRIGFNVNNAFIPLFIVLAVLGQFVGGRWKDIKTIFVKYK